MARVHLFSSSPHNEKRRKLNNNNNNNTSNSANNGQSSINELNRLAQLSQPFPPTISDDTHSLDVTAVPSPNSTSISTSPLIASSSIEQNKDITNKDVSSTSSFRSGAALTAALLQSPPTDIDLVSAFAAILSGKPETIQSLWDKVQQKRDSISAESNQRQDHSKGKQFDETPSTDMMEQEAAATALQLLGLATEKRTSVDEGKNKSTNLSSTEPGSVTISNIQTTSMSPTSATTSTSNDSNNNNSTSSTSEMEAATAVFGQALAHQTQQQHSPSINRVDNNTMLLSNFTGLASSQSSSPSSSTTTETTSATTTSTTTSNAPINPSITQNNNTSNSINNNTNNTTINNETMEAQEESTQDYKRGTWTREEDELLLMGIKKFGYGRWKEIANTIPGRKGKQLKQRWDNTLASKYVDRELLQNKLRHEDQLTKLQQHLEAITSAVNSSNLASQLPIPTSSIPNSINSNNNNNNNNNIKTNNDASSSSSTTILPQKSINVPRVEQADWTEIAHKITEKVREGDQEGIEALLSQALLGTGQPLEHSTTSTITKSESSNKNNNNLNNSTTNNNNNNNDINNINNNNSKNDNTNNIPLKTEENTSPASSSINNTPLNNINYNNTNNNSNNNNNNANNNDNTNQSTTTTPVSTTNTTARSSSSTSTTNALLNYADAAALSLYQQLSQHTSSDGDSSTNPLATIQALANNQYFLTNLFANVEGANSEAALAAAAAAAAAAVAHATATANNPTGNVDSSSIATDATALLAATMKSHLNNANNNNNNNNTGTGASNNNNNTNNNINNSSSNNNSTSNVAPGKSKSTTGNVKRRRSDPALAHTQSEAMSIYASSAPITTIVNNQPQTVYPCLFPNCGKSFARLYNLKSHSRTHTDDRPFSCHLCNTAFSRNHDLKRHLKTHVGEKPYRCKGCQKTFSRLDALKRHKSNARNQAVCLDA